MRECREPVGFNLFTTAWKTQYSSNGSHFLADFRINCTNCLNVIVRHPLKAGSFVLINKDCRNALLTLFVTSLNKVLLSYKYCLRELRIRLP